jgi:hypothetical protein
MAEEKLLLVGCGILHKEIEYLRAKNQWDFDCDFLPPSLHINFKALQTELCGALNCHKQREKIVFYGACHPLMDNILADYHTIRSEGQNCVEMLLGRERFMDELAKGAFFLLEDWAINWEKVIVQTFGQHPQVVKEIFQQAHQYILCINTPCSADFSQAAKAAAAMVDLPLKSVDVSLDFLETTLKNLFTTHKTAGIL